jgi:hypothetical protein
LWAQPGTGWISSRETNLGWRPSGIRLTNPNELSRKNL